jgi:CelD/BcsL family acetyltransferase involved in cellulose biosynthesis
MLTKTMQIKIIDPTIDRRWDEFVDRQKNSTIFHTSAWARVIKDSYNYAPRYYVIEDEAGRLRAAIPFYLIRSILTGKRLVCLPFSDYCCPLGEDADVVLILNSAKKEIDSGAASYLEIRNWQNSITPGHLDLVTRDYNLLYLLDLEPRVDVLKQNLHHNIRESIKQAVKRGVTARVTHDEADLEHFYKLNVATRKKLEVLPQPHAFFKALFRHVISQNLGFMTVAECEGEVIAGCVFLTYGDTIYYKFNASDPNNLKKRPNQLILWETIQYACANNFEKFDLGRCAPEEEGLRTYKTRWGAKEIKLPYYYYPEVKGFTAVSENSLRYRIMKSFSRIAPAFVFKAAGSLLYKHIA